MKIKFNCLNCGAEDSFHQSQIRHYPNSGRFCTIKCRNEYYRSHPEIKYRNAKRVDFGGYRFYTYICVDGKKRREREHRYVMEMHLGRRLGPREHVHHINGDRLDNRLENLIVLSDSEHHKIHSGNPSQEKRKNISVSGSKRWENWRKKNWSKKYSMCINCGKADHRHQAGGLCTKCYLKKYGTNTRGKL